MKAPQAKLRLSIAEELENILVINRHTFTGPQDESYIYIGRGTPLGNQWSHVAGTSASYRVDTREQAVGKYHQWLSAEIAKAEGPVFKTLSMIKDRVAGGEAIKLACSCTPELCHGDVVKASLELIIHNERHPENQLQAQPLQILRSGPILDKSSQLDLSRVAQVSSIALSGRAEQAHTEIITHTVIDNLHDLYNVREGLTRAEHASHLNSIDQFTREAFERGATLNDDVLSIPKDPDGHQREDKVIIGTEAHAINFVRGFIADPTVAAEKGRLLFETANKACGQWIDSHGRFTVFNHIYSQIRQDESGTRRSNEQKAEVIDQVLEKTALWAHALPEPTPEPTAEQVHQLTLSLAEERHAFIAGQIENPNADLQGPHVEYEPTLSPYEEHLDSATYGLATIGELSGFNDLLFDPTIEHSSLTPDENEIYAEIYQTAIFDSLDVATPEGDHLGVERENTTSLTYDATYDRVNLATLPPPLPETLHTHTELFEQILPYVDHQLENGVSKREILAPIYEANRENEQRDLHVRVNTLFARAGAEAIANRPVSRSEELRAISSLRILVASEYRQQAAPFTRESINWAKANYEINPDHRRAQGKLKVGEYQRIVSTQIDSRTAWLNNNPGQQVPTRAQIESINRLEQSGRQLSAAIAGLNPTHQEQAQTLDHIQSHFASTTHNAELLLQGYEATEQRSVQLAAQAHEYANTVRLSPEFQELKATLISEFHENSIDQRQALIRGNNPRFAPLPGTTKEDQTSNYPELTGELRPLSLYAELSITNSIAERDALQTLAANLVSPEIEAQQTLNDLQLSSFNEIANHLTATTITTAAEARDAITVKLQGLAKASAVIDTTRTRFNLPDPPTIVTNLSPAPAYISLASNSNVRIPVENLREHALMLATADQCRLETATWATPYVPNQISGVDKDRGDLVRFVSSYIDFRLQDHTTKELSYRTTNPVFRTYFHRLEAARDPEELLQASTQIKLENYERHQQLVAHRADPENTPAPELIPLTVHEMREVFLSVTPTPTGPTAQLAEMRDILQSMTVFGQEKTERVELLAQGKLAPSPTLAKLLNNLETRQTARAVNHFYSSLRTPADELQTKNSFDLHKAHARLPQYERDFLHTHALAERYQAVNSRLPNAQLTDHTIDREPPITERAEQVIPQAQKTAFYRDYYGRADWLEAQKIVIASNTVERHPGSDQARLTIIPELQNNEVEAINYVINTLDQTRQEQIAEHLQNSSDEHKQAIGDLISLAAEVRAAATTPGAKEIEIQLPPSYILSPGSVTTVVNYTRHETQRAVEATRLPVAELKNLRQEAQSQVWQDLQREVLKNPANLLNAPAETIYNAQSLTQGISETASLQERARFAYQLLNSHTAACIDKAERVVSQEQLTTQPFRTAEQQQTTRDLAKAALSPELQQSQAALIEANAPQFTLIEETLTTTDKERAAQLKDYAAATRADYLRTFIDLDRNQQALKTEETRTLFPTPAPGATLTALNRYATAREAITNTALGDAVQQMVQTSALPQLTSEQLSILTVKDLVPQELRDEAFEQSREPAWQSLEPAELRDAAAGRDVPGPLLTLADNVMDHVATAQTIELELDQSRANLSTFINEQIALVEAPIQEERATLAYDQTFLETITNIASDPNQTPERVNTANQILQTLDRADLDPATLVSQAITHELDLESTDIVLEANASATLLAQETRNQPVFTTAEARANVQQQALAELSGSAADRYAELHRDLNHTEDRFHAALQTVDQKITELDLTRTQLAAETRLQEFREISRPAAIQINNYLNDTVREEGLASLLDPNRFGRHIERVANVIIETARNTGVTLGTTRETTEQVAQVANSLFNTLAIGMERANSEHTPDHQFLIERTTTQQQPLNPQQTLDQLAITPQTMGATIDHAAHDSLDLNGRQKDRIETTRLQDPAGKLPAQDVARTVDSKSTSIGSSAINIADTAASLGHETIEEVLAL